ncbi:hypothetical protein NKG05_15970 [Oerskovia sp. M15]
MGKRSTADLVVRWEGVVDPQRLAALHAWNVETRAWDRLVEVRGVVDGRRP